MVNQHGEWTFGNACPASQVFQYGNKTVISDFEKIYNPKQLQTLSLNEEKAKNIRRHGNHTASNTIMKQKCIYKWHVAAKNIRRSE